MEGYYMGYGRWQHNLEEFEFEEKKIRRIEQLTFTKRKQKARKRKKTDAEKIAKLQKKMEKYDYLQMIR
jgi:hypothetical protein